MREKTFRLATLGCRTNQYETQAYRDQLISLGYKEAKEGEEAELCIINTCTVTESADSSSRSQIRQLARENKEARVVVTGCLADRRPDLLHQIHGVSQVVSNKDKEQLIASLFPEENVPEFSIKNFADHTRAFVKVQDGCNSFCTYCIIPYVRGRSRSRSVSDVVKEVEGLVKEGFKEVVITGINVGDFDGGTGEASLADLVRAVDKVEGLERLRISSIDPDEVNEDLAAAVLEGAKTCYSMHIVLQSGSNVILKKMNRKYTRHVFLETVERLQKAQPDFTFTTDIIVGFPGETEKDFEETLEVVQEVKFAKVHMFPYSRRERTRAALYPNHLSPDVIKERKQRLLRLSEEVSFDLRKRFIGRRMKILTEEGENGITTGHTGNFLRVHVPGAHLPSNHLLVVDLMENTPDGLIGVPVS